MAGCIKSINGMPNGPEWEREREREQGETEGKEREMQRAPLIFTPRVRKSEEYTTVRKYAFVSKHLRIKLIHPEWASEGGRTLREKERD